MCIKAYLSIIEAWSQVIAAWLPVSTLGCNGTVIDVNFTLFFTNAFTLPEGRVCDLESDGCGTVGCKQNGMAPAIYLMTNSQSYVTSVSTMDGSLHV